MPFHREHHTVCVQKIPTVVFNAKRGCYNFALDRAAMWARLLEMLKEKGRHCEPVRRGLPACRQRLSVHRIQSICLLRFIFSFQSIIYVRGFQPIAIQGPPFLKFTLGFLCFMYLYEFDYLQTTINAWKQLMHVFKK